MKKGSNPLTALGIKDQKDVLIAAGALASVVGAYYLMRGGGFGFGGSSKQLPYANPRDATQLALGPNTRPAPTYPGLVRPPVVGSGQPPPPVGVTAPVTVAAGAPGVLSTLLAAGFSPVVAESYIATYSAPVLAAGFAAGSTLSPVSPTPTSAIAAWIASVTP